MKTIRMLVVVSLFFSLASPALAQRRTKKRPARRSTAAKKTPPKQIAQQGVTTASGLTYVITHRGNGRRPQTGETVVVHYTGMLTDGTKFDSSHDRNDPFAFSLGAGSVIKGWDEGVAQLSIGDHAILIIPPELGYGARGAGGVIPANATLVFAVNLIDIK